MSERSDERRQNSRSESTTLVVAREQSARLRCLLIVMISNLWTAVLQIFRLSADFHLFILKNILLFRIDPLTSFEKIWRWGGVGQVAECDAICGRMQCDMRPRAMRYAAECDNKSQFIVAIIVSWRYIGDLLPISEPAKNQDFATFKTL